MICKATMITEIYVEKWHIEEKNKIFRCFEIIYAWYEKYDYSPTLGWFINIYKIMKVHNCINVNTCKISMKDQDAWMQR